MIIRELVNISPHVNKVLKSSLKLMGMQFPEVYFQYFVFS